MAGNKLSFSIALNLLTNSFKNGANSAIASLKNMQMRVLGMAAAFGAGGFALRDITSRLITMARETNQARVTLKNISASTVEYTSNLNYLMNAAKVYGQDLNTLTINFARFSAAGTAAGMALEEQKKIFTSMTKATTSFGLSGEEANLTFMALQQMMSKGKISSEELRRQMGERMPIAMEAMARAAGVSITELDKLLKNGQLISKDILPKFAEELSNLVGDVNLDNIETSVNRLRTEFTYLTESLKIGDFFKKIVDGARGMFESIRSGTSSLVALVIGLLAGKLAQSIFGFYMKLNATRISFGKRVEIAESQMLLATQKRVAAEVALEEAKNAKLTALAGERVRANRAFNIAETNLAKAQAREQVAAATLATAQTNAMASGSATGIKGFFQTIRLGAIKAGIAIKTMIASFAPMIIITGVVSIIAKFVQLRQEANRIKNIFSEYKKELEAVDGGKEVQILQTSLAVLNNKKSTAEEIKRAQSTINSLLGDEIKNQGDINAIVAARIKLIEATAKANYQSNKLAEVEGRMKELKDKNKNIDLSNTNRNFVSVIGRPTSMYGGAYGQPTQTVIPKDAREYQALERVQKDLKEGIAEAVKAGLYTTSSTNVDSSGSVSSGGGGGDKETDLQKAKRKYAESLIENANRLAADNITQEEYTKNVSDAAQEASIAIAGLMGALAKTDDVYNDALEKIIPSLTELEKVQKEYNENVSKLGNLMFNGVISNEEYQDELQKLKDSTRRAAGVLNNIGDEGIKFINSLQGAYTPPGKEERDTFFDYKKTEIDKQKEQLKIEQTYLDELKKSGEKAKLQIEETEKAINDLEISIKNLEKESDLKELRVSISSLKSSLLDNIVNFADNIPSKLDQITKAFTRMKDAMSDTDSSAWEKIVSTVNALTTTVSGIHSLYKGYQELVGIIESLIKAKATEAIITGVSSNAKMLDASASDMVAASGAKQVASSGAVSAANAVESASEVVKASAKTWSAHAWIPFVGVGLAAAGIGFMVGRMTAAKNSIPKYASGGIVGGSNHQGDNVLARVNSGEMILNKAQQSNLFQLANNPQRKVSKDTIKLKIEGRDLVAILNQEQKINNRR